MERRTLRLQARRQRERGHERTLFAVACSRLFGKALASCEPAPGVPYNAYLMTSSARIRIDGGIVISSAWAVVRVLWPASEKWRADSLGSCHVLQPQRRDGQ